MPTNDNAFLSDMMASQFQGEDPNAQLKKMFNSAEPFNPLGKQSNYEDILNMKLEAVKQEVLRAKTLFPANFVNQHEAYAVILEEIDELWDEIKKNQRNYDLLAQQKEATQAAAMLMRLLVEIL